MHKWQGSYDCVSKNLKYLLKKQLEAGVRPLKIRSTLTFENQKDYDRIFDYLNKEFPGARIMIGETMGNSDEILPLDVNNYDINEINEHMNLFAEEIMGKRKIVNKKKFNMKLLWFNRLVDKYKDKTRKINIPQLCGICRNMIAITPDNIYPCHRFVGNEKYVIGNVNRGIDINKTIEIYKSLIVNFNKYCSSCWARYLCGGDCPHYLSNNDVDLFSKPNRMRCELLRKSFEWGLWIYGKIKPHLRNGLYRIPQSQGQNKEYMQEHL